MTYAGDTRRADNLDVLLVANKRKPNFTEGESLYLISQFERNSEILTSKMNDAATNKQKVEVWKRICSDYNSKNPIVLRTANDLKRKWKNMVRAAKKELLESTAHSESGDRSAAPRKLSPVSQKIIEILNITVANCSISAASLGEAAGMRIDGSFVNDKSEQTLLEEGEEEDGETELNGEQQIVHVVVKPEVLVSPASNTKQTEENSAQEISNADIASSSAFSSVNPSTANEEKTPCEVLPKSSGVPGRSSVPTVVVSSIPEVRQLASQPRVMNSSAAIGGGSRHRILVPQQKRMLSSPLAHVIKKKRHSDYGEESSNSHVRSEIDKLKQEKLLLEKEKLALEKDKLMMEKEKLALEIQFLRDQMD